MPSSAALLPYGFRLRRVSGMTTLMDSLATVPKQESAGEVTAALHGIATGDRAALKKLYQLTSAKLYGICLRLLGSESEAEDVLQEVYVTVWRKAAQFDRSKASPITWLATIARNKTIDRLRLRRVATEPMDAASNVADDRPLAFELAERGDEQARLLNCMEQLEERQRGFIRAAFLDGATYPELASREAVPLGTVKSLVRRGLLRLRGCLEQ